MDFDRTDKVHSPKVTCPDCGKRVSKKGQADHQREMHPTALDLAKRQIEATSKVLRKRHQEMIKAGLAGEKMHYPVGHKYHD